MYLLILKKPNFNIMAGKIIKHNVLIRKKGFIYYVDKDGNVCEAARRNGGKKGRRFKKKKVSL